MGWKRKRAEVRQGGGSEVEEEGGSEKEGTKKRGTAEEMRQGTKEEPRQGGGGKRGSALRYSIGRGASINYVRRGRSKTAQVI